MLKIRIKLIVPVLFIFIALTGCQSFYRQAQRPLHYWTDRVIPLPKEIAVPESIFIKAENIRVESRLPVVAQNRTGWDLLRKFALDISKVIELKPSTPAQDGKLVITIALADDVNVPISETLKKRLRETRNSDQAYVIFSQAGKNRIFLVGNTVTGCLNACRTLNLLVKPGKNITKTSVIEIPFAQIMDWPDIARRGQWASGALGTMPWTSQWKLNFVCAYTNCHIDPESGSPEIGLTEEVIKKGHALGVTVEPYIAHLATLKPKIQGAISQNKKLEKYAAALSKPDKTKSKSPYWLYGLCMSDPMAENLLYQWLMKMAAISHKYKNKLGVWLSEGENSPCHCPECKGKNLYELEMKGVIKAFEKVKKTYPNLKLDIQNSQGSYRLKSNGKIIKLLPNDYGLIYYHGQLTYHSDKIPLIYPLMEKFAEDGRKLSVLTQLTNNIRIALPWTAPQFVKYRMEEFVNKKLDGVIGVFCPHDDYHRFNVMAFAEWSWNVSGRSCEEFARAYATVAGMPDPDLFAQWALLAGETGWKVVYNGIHRKASNNPFRKRKMLTSMPEALKKAEQALQVAKKLKIKKCLQESEFTYSSLKMSAILEKMGDIVDKGTAITPTQRLELKKLLEELYAHAKSVQKNLLEWGLSIGERRHMHYRFWQSVARPIRVFDGARDICEKIGVKMTTATIPKIIGKWKPENFKNGKTEIKINVSKLIRKSGRYFVVLEYNKGGKVRVESIDLISENNTGQQRHVFKCGTHKLYVYRGKGKAAECPFLVEKIPANENLFVVIKLSSNKPNSGTIKLRGSIQ